MSFTYRLNDGPSETATADAEGRSTVVVTPDRRGDNFLTVTSQTAEGVVSPETRANLYVPVQVPRPAISSPDPPTDGTPSPAGQPVTIIHGRIPNGDCAGRRGRDEEGVWCAHVRQPSQDRTWWFAPGAANSSKRPPSASTSARWTAVSGRNGSISRTVDFLPG